MKQEKEKKKFVFVTCPVCGCETIANTREIENRCDICHNYLIGVLRSTRGTHEKIGRI